MSSLRQLLSINVAQASPLTIEGRTVMSAIGKQPVSTLAEPRRIEVRPLGLSGDDQADPEVHGGLAKAVYAYPHEHYAFWQTVRAQAGVTPWGATMPHGLPGENLTITGLLESEAWVGDVLAFPDCKLAISEPRRPCFKLEAVMGFRHAIKMMQQSAYCGFYLSVRQAGTLAAGESFELIPGPREVNIAELFKARLSRR